LSPGFQGGGAAKASLGSLYRVRVEGDDALTTLLQLRVGRRRLASCDTERMEQRVSLVTLGVSDLARARAFYEGLGWERAEQPDEEICFFQAGGMVFGLWTALGGHGAPGIELAHNVRSRQEVEAVLTEAEHAGGTVVRPAQDTDWGGYSGAFADADGYVWEVAHNPGWTIGEDGSVLM
jgi:predicted lactoylglutathione lyase